MQFDLARMDTPLATLRRAAAAKASGELVAASDQVEVHIYLLAGRVAWASSSSTRSAFTQHLIEACGVEQESLREAIRESQRTRGRLGETLLSWGLVSEEDLRAALRVQVVSTLEALAGMHECRALFLPRHMEYAAELTFDLEDVLPELQRASSILRIAAAFHVDELLGALADARWAAVLQRDQVSSSHNLSPAAAGLIGRLNGPVCQHGFDMLVVRSAFGSLLGAQHVSGACTAWVAVGPEAKLGVAVSVLASLTGGRSTLSALPRNPAAEIVHHGEPAGGSVEPLEHAMRSADQMLGAVLTQASRASWFGVSRGGFSLRSLWEFATASSRLLAEPYADVLGARPPEAGVVYEHLALRVEANGFVMLHGRLPCDPDMALTLAFERGTAQGLTWALLNTLSRQLSEALQDNRKLS